MNTTASAPLYVASGPTDRVSRSLSRSHKPVVQAFSIAAATISLSAAMVVCLGIVHALISLV